MEEVVDGVDEVKKGQEGEEIAGMLRGGDIISSWVTGKTTSEMEIWCP